MTADKTIRTPWHFWAVAVVLVLWNGLATFDYISSVVQGDDYMKASGMTQAQMAYYKAMPPWVDVAWTASVWGGAAGALAYLLRHRWAAVLLTVSVAGTLGYILYAYALSDGRSAMGVLWPAPAVVAVITACLVGYAVFLTQRAVLR